MIIKVVSHMEIPDEEINKLFSQVPNSQPIDIEGNHKLAYSVKEAAQVLSLGVHTIYELCYQNKIPHFKVGKRTIIPYHGIVKWLNQND